MNDKEKKAIERIKMGSEMSLKNYGQPITCTYSGGKDSDVLLELFLRSGVPFIAQSSHTTADAPQTVWHIRDVFGDLEKRGIKCEIDYHVRGGGKRYTMWNLIPEKLIPPTRRARYCCSVLKESSTKGRMVATGVRWAESANRKGREPFQKLGKTKKDALGVSDEKMLLTDNEDTRRLMEYCRVKGEVVVNPIIDWTDSEVWDYYHTECERHNPLYEMGYYRIGCIGCPLADRKHRVKEFADFPKYRDAYIRAFDAMLEARRAKGLNCREKDGQEVFRGWMYDPNIEGQMDILDFLKEEKGGEND